MTGAPVVFCTVWATVNMYLSSIDRVWVKISPLPLSQRSMTGVAGVSVLPEATDQMVFAPGTSVSARLPPGAQP